MICIEIDKQQTVGYKKKKESVTYFLHVGAKDIELTKDDLIEVHRSIGEFFKEVEKEDLANRTS
jgi:hypothetical protein